MIDSDAWARVWRAVIGVRTAEYKDGWMRTLQPCAYQFGGYLVAVYANGSPSTRERDVTAMTVGALWADLTNLVPFRILVAL